MTTAIATWGNSDAVRIPRSIMRHAGLSRGDQIDFELNERGRIEIVPARQAHRRVAPERGISFDSLFRGYKGDVPTDEPWPDDSLVGSEREAWLS